MFVKWFWSIILCVRTVSILVFFQNSNFYKAIVQGKNDKGIDEWINEMMNE